MWNHGLAEEADLDQAVEALRRRYPGMCIYWGEYTGSLWALLPDHLVEAKNASDLARRIDSIFECRALRSVRSLHVQHEVSPPRALDGTWDTPKRKVPPARDQFWPADPEPRRRRSLLGWLLVGFRRIMRGPPHLAPPVR
ncbi:hypothetical protein E1200_04885 [Actinomadura sp. GC306]|uniref:hypothetical protein n=1 Tax=Actinomadura sp. GC306 TaxID=2530367 RepID=UPI0010523152|nr:hypothetical protein [Actinomadura sp. GC306]TDC70574.1 hypothetical protein E1200_04885 [Actinomadura sp. GC306]